MGVDIARIKQYNSRVAEGKQKVAQVRAEIQVTKREIERLCKELTNELGVEVNEQNIEQIYNEHVANIMRQVENGEQILNRIDDASASYVAGEMSNNMKNVGNIGTSSYGQSVAQQMNAATIEQFGGQRMASAGTDAGGATGGFMAGAPVIQPAPGMVVPGAGQVGTGAGQVVPGAGGGQIVTPQAGQMGAIMNGFENFAEFDSAPGGFTQVTPSAGDGQTGQAGQMPNIGATFSI